MTKLYSLFGGTTTDTEVKAVEVNQVVQMEGYACDHYVVHKITHNEYGCHYHLINPRTLDMQQSEIIKPLSQKFGIGMYYDENNIEFKTNEEVAELYAKAQEKKVNRIEKEREEEKQREAIRVIGRQWLNDNLPEDAQALIVAKLKTAKPITLPQALLGQLYSGSRSTKEIYFQKCGNMLQILRKQPI